MSENKYFLNSMEEIRALLKIGRKSFHKLRSQGLPATKVGRGYRGHRGKILNWWKDHLAQNEKDETKEVY